MAHFTTVYHGDILPNGMVPLHTSQGQELLQKTTKKNKIVVNDFKPQIGDTNCGPTSLALVLNAINSFHVKLSDPDLTDTEYEILMEKMNDDKELILTELDIINHGKVKDYFRDINIEKNGMTLLQLGHVATRLGYGVNTYFAYNNSIEISEDKKSEFNDLISSPTFHTLETSSDFEALVENRIRRPVTGVILNYDMSKLGYTSFPGHHSPIGALNDEMILVMDVWKQTKPAWVDKKLLFDAMSTVDSDCGFPRGLLHIHELL
uniref:glutathione gamma-glutamylcysteinyltransferase n=1 Tax=Clytia hemisphaerica TaxID=252671 RepID=A0A7M5UBQ9_9CNID